MNRKTFFATIAAIITAPFVKANEPDWKKANPVLLEMPKLTIKGEDLVYIIDRKKWK